MKVKKIMLVTLMLLAIITIGAVSAADNLSDTPASDQLEISGDDAVVSNDDSQILEKNGTGSDDSDPEEPYHEDSDDERQEIDPDSIRIPEVYVTNIYRDEIDGGIGLPWDYSGHMTFKLGDKIIYDQNVYYDEVYLNLDGEKNGIYDWQLNCTGDSNYKPLYMNGSIELTYLAINVPEKIILYSGNDNYISATFSIGVSGTITVYIDGKKYETEIIDDEDYSGTSFNMNRLSLGEHSYEVIYTGNKDSVRVNGTLNVDYVFEIENYEDTATYGKDLPITVILPWDASGKLTATVNGKSFEVDVESLEDDYYDTNYIKMEIGNLNISENTVTVTYSGNDKYSAKTGNITVNAAVKIQYEHTMVYTNPYIFLQLPDDAKGNLIVKIEDDVFANVSAKSGLFNVSLKSLKMGLYHMETYYDGEDYSVDSTNEYISIIPNITAPQIVGYLEGAWISIEIPSDANGTFTIYKGADEDYWTLINSTEIENGKASLFINSFYYSWNYYDDYYNYFTLEFKGERYTYQTYYTPRVMSYPRDTDFEVSVDETVLKSSEYMVCRATDSISRNYKVYIDGKLVGETWNGIDPYDEYPSSMEISVSDLTYGRHKIEFRYTDDDGYYNSINKTYYFNITYIKIAIPDEIIDFGEVEIRFDEGVTGNVTLYIDGKEYDSKKIDASDYSFEYFYIDSLPYGTHEFEVVYYGDAAHGKVTKKSMVDFTYPISLNGYEYGETLYVTYGQNKDITVKLPWNVTGNVSITVNGKKYTAKAHDYTDMTIGNFAFGKDEIALTYEGDGKYPAKTVKYPVMTYAEILDENNVISLILPSDACGNLTVVINGEEYQTEALLNGKAVIDLNAFENMMYFVASYTGEDYTVYDIYGNYMYNITAPEYVWIEEGALITANLPADYEGEIIVYQYHGSYYDDENVEKTEINRTTLVNGYGTVRITSFDGISREDDGEYEDYYNYYSIEYVNGGLVKHYMSYYPKVMPDSPDRELEFTYMEKEIIKDSYLDVFTNMDSERYGGFFNVYIDGDYYRRYYDSDITVQGSDLAYGTHTIKVDYSGNEYYSKSTASAQFNVTWIIVLISDEVAVGEYYDEEFSGNNLFTYANEDAKGYVLIYIDDEIVCADFVSYRGISVDLSNCTAGNHTYKVVYSGDAKYEPVTKSGTFRGVYSGMLITDSYIYAGEDENIKVVVPKDATGKIELTVNEDKYTEVLVNGTARFTIKGLSAGEYNVSAKYLGDDKYDAYVVGSDEITVNGHRWYDIKVDAGDELHYGDSVTISLELAQSAEGELQIYINDEFYNTAALVDGKAKIVISNMTYGEYDIYGEYSGDQHDFGVNSLYKTIKISPKIGEYSLVNDVGDEIIIPIEFESDANGDLKIYDDDKLVGSQKVTNGKINLNLTGIVHFDYNYLTIRYDDGKYNYTDSISIKVYPKLTYPENITIGQSCDVSFMLPEDFNGELEIKVYAGSEDPIMTAANVVGGKASATLTGLISGYNYLYYTYKDGNYTFYPYTYYDNGYEPMAYLIYVEKLDADVEVTNSSEATRVQFDADTTGEILVKINGEYYYCVLENGEAEFNAPASEIVISYSGDELYKSFKNMPVNSTGSIAELADPELSVSAADVDVGSNATISVKASSSLTADVNVTVDGRDYTVNVKNGKGSVEIENLTAKTYTVTVTFAGNDAFKKSKNTTEFIVCKLTPEIVIKADESIVEQSDLAVEVTIAGATGNVKINGQTVALENAKASANITGLALGENTITVIYSGDDMFANATKSVKVNVYAKADPELNVTVADTSAGKTATVSIEIAEAATGNVIVTFNGTDTALNISNGKASMELSGLGEGTYTVTAKYGGNKYLTSGEANATFRVSKFASEVSISDIKFTYGGSGTALMTLIGASGAEAVVVDHPEAVVKVEADKITVSNLSAGQYSLKVTAIPLPDYAASSATATVTVSKMATKISSAKVTTTYATSKNVVVTLKDANNKAVEGKTVTLVLNKKPYTANTNAKGQITVKLPTNLAAKTYTATLSFEGDANYAPSTGSVKVVVGKAKSKITAKAKTFKKSVKTKKYSVTLKSDKNKAISKVKVTLKIGKKTFKATTTAKGVATFKITKLTKTAKAVVKFAGNNNFKASSKTVKITVK